MFGNCHEWNLWGNLRLKKIFEILGVNTLKWTKQFYLRKLKIKLNPDLKYFNNNLSPNFVGSVVTFFKGCENN